MQRMGWVAATAGAAAIAVTDRECAPGLKWVHISTPLVEAETNGSSHSLGFTHVP